MTLRVMVRNDTERAVVVRVSHPDANRFQLTPTYVLQPGAALDQHFWSSDGALRIEEVADEVIVVEKAE